LPLGHSAFPLFPLYLNKLARCGNGFSRGWFVPRRTTISKVCTEIIRVFSDFLLWWEDLFTFSLFNDAFSWWEYIASNGRTNNELNRMLKEGVLAQFKVIFQKCPGATEENYQKPRSE
jgi:hypothetical protein